MRYWVGWRRGLRGARRCRRIDHDGDAIDALFADLFLDSHERAPARLVLDLDATDDPLHGRQEGRFFHGYHVCCRYLPLFIFCGNHNSGGQAEVGGAGE